MIQEAKHRFAGPLIRGTAAAVADRALERTIGPAVDRAVNSVWNTTASGAREVVSFTLNKGLERSGLILVEEEKSVALTAKVDAQRALWALKGMDHLFPNRIDGEARPDNPRVDDLRTAVSQYKKRKKTPSDNIRLDALVHRLLGVKQRKELLEEVFANAQSGDRAVAREARRRLGLVMDIVDDKFEKPNPHAHKAVILTQTAYLLGDEGEKRHEPNGNGKLKQLEKLGIDLASGSLPYLGAAVVYAELMATGRFSDIEIIDFRDKEAIDAMLQRGDREYAFISGATTFDDGIIEGLNKKLSEEGLKVVNGGVAAGITRHPDRYLDNGGSLFVGDFEGAADRLIDELEADAGPQVYLRGFVNKRTHRLDKMEIPYKVFPLPERAFLHAAYAPERELDGQRLANRLLALEMMRPTVEVDGMTYEPPVSLKIHETSTSYGCPETCSYCATVPLQGIDMRARSTLSLFQEWEAVESTRVAIVDQNFIANGRDKTTAVLRVAKQTGKRVAFEGELSYFRVAPPDEIPAPQNFFFDGTLSDRERERLLQSNVTAIAVGLEQPVQVRGARSEKDPSSFMEAQTRLNELGIKTAGTMVIGMPPQLWDGEHDADLNITPYTNLSPDKWADMVHTWVKWAETLGVVGPVIFNFTPIEGTPAFERLEKEKLLIQLPNGQFDVKGIDGRRAGDDIRGEIYSIPSIARRIRNTNLSPRDKVLMSFYNLVAGRAFRTTMD